MTPKSGGRFSDRIMRQWLRKKLTATRARFMVAADEG